MTKGKPISLKTAKLLKEIGYIDSNNLSYYKGELTAMTPDISLDDKEDVDNYFNGLGKDIRHHAPSITWLHQWLIEEHGIYILVIPTVTSDWTFKSIRVISKLDNDVIIGLKSVYDLPPYYEVSGEDFSTNLDALEAGIFEGLKQVKEFRGWTI